MDESLKTPETPLSTPTPQESSDNVGAFNVNTGESGPVTMASSDEKAAVVAQARIETPELQHDLVQGSAVPDAAPVQKINVSSLADTQPSMPTQPIESVAATTQPLQNEGLFSKIKKILGR